MKHPGVWCCELRTKCKWSYAVNGLFWAEQIDEIKRYHDLECNSKLIQLLPPNDKEITDTERLDFLLSFMNIYAGERNRYYATIKYMGLSANNDDEPLRDIIDRAIIKERDAKIAREG